MIDQAPQQPSAPNIKDQGPKRSFLDRLRTPEVAAGFTALALLAGAAGKARAGVDRVDSPKPAATFTYGSAAHLEQGGPPKNGDSSAIEQYEFPFDYSKLSFEKTLEPDAKFLNVILNIPVRVNSKNEVLGFRTAPNDKAQRFPVTWDFIENVYNHTSHLTPPSDNYLEMDIPRHYKINGEDWLLFCPRINANYNGTFPVPPTTKNKSLQERLIHDDVVNSWYLWLKADELPAGTEVFQPKLTALGNKHEVAGVLHQDHYSSVDNIPITHKYWEIPGVSNIGTLTVMPAQDRVSDQKYFYQNKQQSLYTRVNNLESFINSK